MKLKSIKLENFKGMEDTKIDLDSKSTVLFGVNGVGKSTILRAINLLYSSIINKVVQNRFKQGINIELSDITFGRSYSKLIMDVVFQDKVVLEYSRTMERKTKKRTHSKEMESILNRFVNEHLSEDDELSNMPIFVNYSVNRLVIDIPLRIRNTHIFDKPAAFEKAIESKIDFRTFFEWYRYQEDLENEIKANGDLKYEDRALKATKKAITTMLENVSNLRVQRNPLSMKVDKDGVSLSVDQLSDGEKCTLALLGDLTRRLSLANPSLENPLNGEGVVLIDEIELHMHPAWQRRILATLKSLFPNIQFIVTTHSPQVLGEIGKDFNIISLNKDGKQITITKIGNLEGWDSNYILETFMETSSIKIETKREISKMYKLISEKNYDEAQKIADELEYKTNKNNPDVINARMLIMKGRRGL